jgi:tetratricopeptide (TPR) repeat protein
MLVAVTGVLAATGCGVSDEIPPGGDPKVIAAAPTTEPVPTELIPVVTSETSSTTVLNENVTYSDAEIVYRKGDYKQASELFEAYTLRKPENVWGHYMLGISAWKAGNHEKAEGALRKTIELDPNHGKGFVNLARVLLEQNRPAAALDYAEQGVELTPESVDAWRVLANARSDLGVVDDAVEAYRRALTLDEEDTWSMNNLGLLMIRKGRYEEALPPLARAVQLKPGSVTFQNNLGIALERSGYLTAAAETFRAVLALSPEHAKAKTSLERVELRIMDGDWPPVDLTMLAGMFSDEIKGWREQK